jgi:hypothetical protein
MRLLNTKTYTLHTFFGKAIPKYAILSHRWEDEEVLFQDLESGRAHSMPGYAKIRGCCRQARKDHFEYAWIDTCCIDKSSSAELSEAINSMFQWYKDSNVCYAYLSDVTGRGDRDQVLGEFARSIWFDRGWTLQELLAPNNVVSGRPHRRNYGNPRTFLVRKGMHRGEDVMGVMEGNHSR